MKINIERKGFEEKETVVMISINHVWIKYETLVLTAKIFQR